jgi:hypothetical protein
MATNTSAKNVDSKQSDKKNEAITKAEEMLFAGLERVTNFTSTVKKNNTSKFLTLPDGTAFRPSVIARVAPTDNGVVIQNSGGEMLGFIAISDPDIKRSVQGMILECADDLKGVNQPDWNTILGFDSNNSQEDGE